MARLEAGVDHRDFQHINVIGDDNQRTSLGHLAYLAGVDAAYQAGQPAQAIDNHPLRQAQSTPPGG
jgi:hypothetical protein